MLKEIRPALVLLVALTALTGVAYPLAVTGAANALFPDQAQGSIVRRPDGTPVGSALIGQAFTGDRYLHGRPSATTAPDPSDASKTVAAPYNAASSGGSNLGPTSKDLVDRVAADMATLKRENPGAAVPADLVTTSASGLDPHVSPDAALFQVPRIAAARHLPEDRVRAVVTAAVEEPMLGVVGERRVNVLAVNMALDALPSP